MHVHVYAYLLFLGFCRQRIDQEELDRVLEACEMVYIYNVLYIVIPSTYL